MTTVTGMAPAAVISAAGISAVNCVDETKVVMRSKPFHCTCEVCTKSVPFMVSVKAAPPTVEEEGIKLLIPGTGFSVTVVLAVVLLFAGLVSDETLPVMLAVLVNPEPTTVGLTPSVTVAPAPLLIEPRVQVTVFVPVHAPCVGVAET